MTTHCIDESTVVAFLGGSLPVARRSAVESHVGACAACADLATWAAADIANRSRSAGREGRPFIGQLAPGSRVDRYQVLAAVGRGGMGEVYAAYHPDLDRRIALKVVDESGANAPERRARLLREARAIARLSHPNVVAVHDAGTFGDRVYIAMEFVAGETVDAWLRTAKRPWSEILDVFVAAGRGLAAAHAAGIIHRDFKPQNVMVGKDGSVRVMDFGLARLAQEPIEERASSECDQRPQPATVTKTGALVGTLAYMAPEQFRGDVIDARADQYSFCVALHETVYGQRPTLAHLQTAQTTRGLETPGPARSTGAPAWLRTTIARGLSPDREQRFASMDSLLGSLTRGRTRARRRISALAVGLAAVLMSLGGWRLAAARRISCAVPLDRLARVWAPNDEQNPRRQAVRRAFLASRRPTAEMSWQRVSKVLDDYVTQWSVMYVQTCEATHASGEQSADVLDLRMSCLNDNLDQVRAFTNVLAGADDATLGGAVAAAHDLTPVSRCADVTLLRLAIPLPRDQRTLDAVLQLRSELREAEALRDIADLHAAWVRATALKPRIEATKYRPLLAQVLELIGSTEMWTANPDTEATLREALFTAESAHDDVTAAKAAIDLIFQAGYVLDKPSEAEIWLQLGESVLDRLGPGHERLRAWALHNFASAVYEKGDLQRSRDYFREALDLKERVLGKDHPDVAITLESLADVHNELGQPADALRFADRGLDILARNGDPESDTAAILCYYRGDALVKLDRSVEAEASFAIALRIMRKSHSTDRLISAPLQGIGEARIVQGKPGDAIPILEEALRIREAHDPAAWSKAETQFSLARALWESGRNRVRANELALQARRTYGQKMPWRQRAVSEWLAAHKQPAR